MSTGAIVPDARFIRREVFIGDVAVRLGLRGNGRRLYCWREAHTKRSARPTVGVHLKSNSLRCFDCDRKNLSPVDLVASVRGCSVGRAFEWLACEYPNIPKVRLETMGDSSSVRTWDVPSCDALVLSPAWARLSHSEKALACAIIARVPRERDTHPLFSCSYDSLQRLTGIGNRRTLSKALGALRRSGLIQTALVPTGKETKSGFATRQTLVRLTWHSARFQAFIAPMKSRVAHNGTCATLDRSQYGCGGRSVGRRGLALGSWVLAGQSVQ